MRLHPRLSRPALALALALISATPSLAQVTTGSTPKAPAGPPIPLAHFVPGGEIIAYFEFEGLAAHADAWQKSALYQVLNTTPVGPMLEDVAAQVLDQAYAKLGSRWASGKEIVALVEHVAQNGFVAAQGGKPGDAKSEFGVVVLRGAFRGKELRPLVGRMLGAMYDPKAKPKAVDAAGHKIVVAKTKDGKAMGYWVEDGRKEDLVLIPDAANEAAVVAQATNVLAALDGTHPDAQADPIRQALAKEEEGFAPVGYGYANLVALPPQSLPPGFHDLKGFDVRWGFQDKETVTVFRVSAPKPREGMLAILDQPTFDKSGLPPVPEGVEGFAVVSLNLLKTYDQLAALAQAAKPDAAAQIEGFAEQFQAKTKLRLKEDVLAHVGPKIAVYNAPASRSADAKAAAPSGPLAALLGGKEIPRLTIVVEIDDPKVFGRSLDALMIAANQGLRSLAPMLSAVAAPPDANRGGDAPGGPGGRPQGKAARAAATTLEFKQVGTGVYTMSPPPVLDALIPKYVRPTVRLGTKYLVISVSPEAARAALEVKGGGAAGTTFASTLQAAPGGLISLQVADSADSIATGLAEFPARLQALADKAAAPPGVPPGFGPPGGSAPGGPGMSMPGAPAMGNRKLAGMSAGGGPSQSRPPGMPGMSMPGMSGGPGGNQAAESKGLFTLRVDPATLPSASAIKPLLVPSLATVSVDDDGVTITLRESFPDLPGMLSGNSMATVKIDSELTKATTAAQAAAAANAPAAAAPGGPGGPGMPPGGPRGPGGPSMPGGRGPGRPPGPGGRDPAPEPR